MSPAVLARSAVEYASRTNYIASEDDHPTVRMSKMARLFADGYNNLGLNSPKANPDEVKVGADMNRWRRRISLPAVKLPNYTDLVNELADVGKNSHCSIDSPTPMRLPWAGRSHGHDDRGPAEPLQAGDRFVAACIVRLLVRSSGHREGKRTARWRREYYAAQADRVLRGRDALRALCLGPSGLQRGNANRTSAVTSSDPAAAVLPAVWGSAGVAGPTGAKTTVSGEQPRPGLGRRPVDLVDVRYFGARR